MRALSLWFCGLLLAAMPAAAQAPAAPVAAVDETAVRDLIGRYVKARELKDPKAVEALFTPDADQYTTSGDWRRGQAQIVAGTARSSAQNPGVRGITVESVRFVTADVAIADGQYAITARDGTAPARRMWTSIVAVRTPAGWRISAIRNMVPTGQTRTPPERP